MKIFTCPSCGGRLFFSNLACGCGAEVAFDPEGGRFEPLAQPCANRDEIGCNWQADGDGGLCRSCDMTEVIPDAFHGDNIELWSEAELAKRWVLADLARWGWFRNADAGRRPVFHLLAEKAGNGAAKVTMGHLDGVVTINVNEADPTALVQRREALDEPLRTMVGHFRHEISHFLFERLAERPDFLNAFRERFGDETADYAAALEAYYRDGPRPDWADRHVSEYAASHPHEDWAESLAHVMHLTDIIDSFVAAGFNARAPIGPGYDAYAERDAERLITGGASLGIGLNHVNRAMGLDDLYPFVLAAETRAKLAFAHGWIREAG